MFQYALNNEPERVIYNAMRSVFECTHTRYAACSNENLAHPTPPPYARVYDTSRAWTTKRTRLVVRQAERVLRLLRWLRFSSTKQRLGHRGARVLPCKTNGKVSHGEKSLHKAAAAYCYSLIIRHANNKYYFAMSIRTLGVTHKSLKAVRL